MQIKGQIDAEHHQFRHARFDHLARYHGIVRTKTNVPDVAQLLALEHVADKIRLKHAAIVLFGIDEKDHAEINIPEQPQILLKKARHNLEIPADVVLAAKVCGTNVPLDRYLLAALPQRLGNVLPHLLARHKDV